MSGFQGSYITCTSAPPLLFSVIPYADLRSLIVHNFWRNALRDFESFAYMHEIFLGFPRSLLGVLLSCSSKKKEDALCGCKGFYHGTESDLFPFLFLSTLFPSCSVGHCNKVPRLRVFQVFRDLFFSGCEGFYHRTESDLFPSLLCISS